MSEKLTKESAKIIDDLKFMVNNAMRFGYPEGALEKIDGIMAKFEEAVREETRAEVLKDHFKIHETIEARNIDGGWNRLTVTLQPEGMYPEPMEYRRPPKMRPTTRNENERAIHERTGIDWGKPFLGALSESTIRAMASDMGIPTEVPE